MCFSSDSEEKQCRTPHGDRFNDTNGSAEMRPSQVTYVTLASGTFNRTLSPHRTCSARVLRVTHTRLVQHTLVKLASGRLLCVVCLQKLPGYACCLQQNRCLSTEGFSRPCSLQSKTSPLAVSSPAAPIEKFLVVVIWHRSWLRGSARWEQTIVLCLSWSARLPIPAECWHAACCNL